jgi:hypothetical protein
MTSTVLLLIYSTLQSFGLPIRALPNVVVEWLTLLILIREVQGLNLGPETGYPD